MHRYRILCLIISSCFALLLLSCAVKTVKGFKQDDVVSTTFNAPYFLDAKTDYVYKAHITVYNAEMGGIFIIKKMNDTLYRAAFTTEFGNKLFDFEISDNNFKVNYILEDIDSKIVVNTLKKDFMLLLKKQHTVNEQYESAESTVYKSKDGKRYNYLFIDKASGKLMKLVNATKSKEKISITYSANDSESNILAKDIVIDHKNIKLKIELHYLNQ